MRAEQVTEDMDAEGALPATADDGGGTALFDAAKSTACRWRLVAARSRLCYGVAIGVVKFCEDAVV